MKYLIRVLIFLCIFLFFPEANSVSAIDLKSFKESIRPKESQVNKESNKDLGEKELKEAVKLHEEGKLKEAAVIYREFLKKDPKSAIIWNNLGLIFQEQKKYDYAEKYYNKALELDPKEVQALNNLAFLKVETGDFTEAEKLYKLAIDKDPDYVYSYSNLASLYKKIGKMFSAVSFYKKALDKLPVAEMYYRLSLVYYDMKRYDDMFEALNLALKEDINYSEAYYSLAFIHFFNLVDYEPEKREAEFKKAFNELLRLNKPMAEEFDGKYLKNLKNK